MAPTMSFSVPLGRRGGLGPAPVGASSPDHVTAAPSLSPGVALRAIGSGR